MTAHANAPTADTPPIASDVADLLALVPDGKLRVTHTRSTAKAKNLIARCEATIAAHGFTLRYVDWCEDAETPGFPGYYRGVTSHRKKTVKIATKTTTGRGVRKTTHAERLAIIAHELKHVLDPAWDCGNRLL